MATVMVQVTLVVVSSPLNNRKRVSFQGINKRIKEHEE